MTLQEAVTKFVNKYANRRNRAQFVVDLREIMNLYAMNAIKHGALPEKGVPHGNDNR